MINTHGHTASERGWVVVRHDRQEESEASPFAATPFPYTKSTWALVALPMSIAWRIAEIETGIPFEDVHPSWSKSRDVWLSHIRKYRAQGRQLARLVGDFLDALTPKSRGILWGRDHDEKFRVLRDAFKSMTQRELEKQQLGVELHRLLDQIAEVAIPPPPPSEAGLLGPGKADALMLGDDGPCLEVGAACVVLDIRMVWCLASISDVRHPEEAEEGFKEYRVHYHGWSKRYDEWLRADTGRIKERGPAPQVGLRCLAFCHRSGWHDASIIGLRDVDDDNVQKVKVHYKGWGKSYDEWVDEGCVCHIVQSNERTSTSVKSSSSCTIEERSSTASSSGRKSNEGIRGVTVAVAQPSMAPRAEASSEQVGEQRESKQSTNHELVACPPPDLSKVLKETDGIEEGMAVVAMDIRKVWCDAKVVKMRMAKHKARHGLVTAVKLRFEGASLSHLS